MIGCWLVLVVGCMIHRILNYEYWYDRMDNGMIWDMGLHDYWYNVWEALTLFDTCYCVTMACDS